MCNTREISSSIVSNITSSQDKTEEMFFFHGIIYTIYTRYMDIKLSRFQHDLRANSKKSHELRFAGQAVNYNACVS